MTRTAQSVKCRQRGISILVTTLALMIIVPLVGLAIDLSMLYLIKTKLLSATDAAVLAGARALSRGTDPGGQRTAAQTAAAKFFHANFPDGYWGSTSLTFPTPVVDDNSVPNYRTVTATASVQAPLYFLRVLGQNYSTVAASAQAARRDALVMIVLDRSSSMDRDVAGTGQTACAIMKQDAKEFIKYFAPGRDQLGLVVFNAGAYRLAPTTNFVSPINTTIDQIDCNGNTGSAEALWSAYDAILTVNSTTRANVIVFMTDGISNGFTGNFTAYRKAGCDSSGLPLIGLLVQWSNFGSTGQGVGLMEDNAPDVSSDNYGTAVNSTGCRFRIIPPDHGDPTRVDEDVTRMPANDVHGNALAGTYSTYSNAYVSWMGVPATLTAIDSPRDIGRASANALDNMATTIRSNTTLKPMIYTIGLDTDPTGSDHPDPQLLKKLANDPTLAQDPAPGPTFFANQVNQTRGMFVNCPDATQLQAAFDAIATNIVVRLAM